MNVILVGGLGYLGSRLNVVLQGAKVSVDVVDPGILQGIPDSSSAALAFSQDVLQMSVPSFTEDDVVVWLASIHEVPDESRLVWQDVAYELMVTVPLRWASAVGKAGGRFIYISSTRAATHTDRLYGWNKRRFEILTVAEDHVTVLRPGTIWGALSETLPNRTQTVINRMLTDATFQVEPHTEPFFTCHMYRIVGFIKELIRFSSHVDSGLILAVVDTGCPVTGAILASGKRPPGYAAEPVPENLPVTEHPMKLYETYYFGDRNA